MSNILIKTLWLKLSLTTTFIFTFLLSSLIFYQVASAQVAITLGAQEIYDDNIYLEDDSSSLPTFITDPATRPEDVTEEDIERLDGDPTSDFITASTLSISWAIPTGKFLKTGAQGSVGALMFADHSSENRITLDSDVLMESTKELLGESLFFDVSSKFDSQSSTIGVAEGSAARQAQSHSAQFRAGEKNLPINDKVSIDAYYTLLRYDFLKEFTLDEERNDSLIKAQGNDYLKNAFDVGVKNKFSDVLSGKLTSGVEYLSFTGSNEIQIQQEDQQESQSITYTDSAKDLNRVNYNVISWLDYELSQLLKVSGKVGFESSYFNNIDDSGSTDSSDSSIDDNSSSLTYGLFASYTPDLKTVLSPSIEQSSGTDSTGARVLARTATFNISRKLTDSVSFVLGNRFLQFSTDDSLSKSTDRYELSTTFTVSLTDTIVLSTGVNYANQSKDSNDTSSVINEMITSYGADDYKSTRFFIALSGGLVGI